MAISKKTVVLILLICLVTRVYALSARPVDHDESIHAWMSYILEKTGKYHYDPTYHGPLLYHIAAFVFYLFGDSIFNGRMIIVAFTLIGIFFACLYERWMGRNVYIFLFVLLFSPSVLYYSRYMRNDMILVPCFIAAVYFYLRYTETSKPYFAWASSLFLSLMVCAKENSYIYLFIFLTFPLIYGVYRYGFDYVKDKLLHWNKNKILVLAGSIAVYVFIFAFFYTSAFRRPYGLYEGTFGAIGYWIKMHELRDHWEPIYYYTKIFLEYEFLSLGLFFGGAAIFLKKFLESLESFKIKAKSVKKSVKSKFSSISRFEAFAFYWAVLSLIAYHVLNHKIPWLTVHMVVPMALLGSIYYRDCRFTRAALAIAMIATLVVAIHVTYIDYNNAWKEDLVYIQAQPSIVKLADRIIHLRKEGYSVLIYEPKNDYWPLPWYLRHYTIAYSSRWIPGFDYVVTTVRALSQVKEYSYRVIGVYQGRPGWYYYLMKKY